MFFSSARLRRSSLVALVTSLVLAAARRLAGHPPRSCAASGQVGAGLDQLVAGLSSVTDRSAGRRRIRPPAAGGRPTLPAGAGPAAGRPGRHPRAPSPSPGRASERPRRPGRSWSASCPTTCGRRWPGCGRWLGGPGGRGDRRRPARPGPLPQHGGPDDRPGRRPVRAVPGAGRSRRPSSRQLVSLAEVITDVASEAAATARAAPGHARRRACRPTTGWPCSAPPTTWPARWPIWPATRSGTPIRAERSGWTAGRVATARSRSRWSTAAAASRRRVSPGSSTPAGGGRRRAAADDGGAGLGLAIARGVVESHAGAIRVANVDGGCRFEVALPASRRTESADRP